MTKKRRGRNFCLSEEVKALIAHGQKAAIGDSISYLEWSAVAGVDIVANRHLLYSALYRLKLDNGIVFGCVEGFGYKRLNASEMVGVQADYIPKISRATRRAKQIGRVAAESYGELSREKQVEFNMANSLLGTLAAFSSPHQVRAQKRKYANDNLPPELHLDQFAGS